MSVGQNWSGIEAMGKIKRFLELYKDGDDEDEVLRHPQETRDDLGISFGGHTHEYLSLGDLRQLVASWENFTKEFEAELLSSKPELITRGVEALVEATTKPRVSSHDEIVEAIVDAVVFG